MDKEVIKNATPEQFYENVSGILYTLSLNETGGVDCNMYCSIKDVEQKDQTIAELEAKLAESEKLNKGYLSLIDNYIFQLNEKDELLRQKINKMKSTDFIRMCVSCGFMVQAKENDNQTAIAELEKVVGFMKTRDEWGFFPEQMSIAEYIDQQIKSLKGEK